jgi:hypothetical protein
MLTQTREWERARPGRPFTTAEEGAAWMAAWCQRCHLDVDETCPLVTIAVCGETPAAWRPVLNSREPADKYHCMEWVPRSGV